MCYSASWLDAVFTSKSSLLDCWWHSCYQLTSANATKHMLQVCDNFTMELQKCFTIFIMLNINYHADSMSIYNIWHAQSMVPPSFSINNAFIDNVVTTSWYFWNLHAFVMSWETSFIAEHINSISPLHLISLCCCIIHPLHAALPRVIIILNNNTKQI